VLIQTFVLKRLSGRQGAAGGAVASGDPNPALIRSSSAAGLGHFAKRADYQKNLTSPGFY